MSINTHDGPSKSYYTCEINGNLKKDQEDVITDTSENTRSNEEVTMVYYFPAHYVTFIPNSLFDTFVNLEFLLIHFANSFETMKREYLRNANKLTSFWVYGNSLKKINGNVFAEAKFLEHINFYNNEIESIHKEAFNGLPYLKNVYLETNNIKKLHPKTFSFIANLNILELGGGKNCVNEKFTSASQKLPEIEAKISSNCTYVEIPSEVAEENRIKMQEANDKIGNLTAEAQAKQEKFEEMSNKLEEMKAQLSSQEEKHAQDLANQQKEFDAKITFEKLQMETKNYQNDANLTAQKLELLQECKSELQLEFINHKNQIDSKFATEKLQMEAKNNQMEAKLTAQKSELLLECKLEARQEIAKHSFEDGKLAGQMMTLQNMYLSLVNRINDKQKKTSSDSRQTDHFEEEK